MKEIWSKKDWRNELAKNSGRFSKTKERGSPLFLHLPTEINRFIVVVAYTIGRVLFSLFEQQLEKSVSVAFSVNVTYSAAEFEFRRFPSFGTHIASQTINSRRSAMGLPSAGTTNACSLHEFASIGQQSTCGSLPAWHRAIDDSTKESKWAAIVEDHRLAL